MPFDKVPDKCSLKLEPFKAHVSDLKLEGLKFLLRVSPIGPPTYENQNTDVNDYTAFGIKRDWLEKARDYWIEKYDWRKTEARFNTYNHWTTEIEDQGFKFNVHFVGLFSKKPDAIPLLLIHGWPGSFIEFLDVLDEFKSKYDENSLPFSIVVPSLPGYAYSNGPPLDRNMTTEDAAKVMDKLMVGLGYGDGYVTQGGDIGSFISRILGTISDSCKAVHSMLPPRS
jgi:microsomal epoxide hydrolase